MSKMKIYDTRMVAKKLAEFITPEPLRAFLADKVKGKSFSVLEPSIGSGQLLFNLLDRIKSVCGYDTNELALACALENISDAELHNQDFITSDIKKHDIAICNYPFSLRPTEVQKAYILKDAFLSQFYKNKVTGVLDFIFILKSFNAVDEGFYLCFPGIGYRQQEKRFREYLIQNRFIREYGLIEECKFEHTGISILFLHLTKQPNERINSFRLNLKTGEKIEKEVTLQDTFETPHVEQLRLEYDPVDLEKNARESAFNSFKTQVQMSIFVQCIDEQIQRELQPVDVWLENCINELKALIAKD